MCYPLMATIWGHCSTSKNGKAKGKAARLNHFCQTMKPFVEYEDISNVLTYLNVFLVSLVLFSFVTRARPTLQPLFIIYYLKPWETRLVMQTKNFIQVSNCFYSKYGLAAFRWTPKLCFCSRSTLWAAVGQGTFMITDQLKLKTTCLYVHCRLCK